MKRISKGTENDCHKTKKLFFSCKTITYSEFFLDGGDSLGDGLLLLHPPALDLLPLACYLENDPLDVDAGIQHLVAPLHVVVDLSEGADLCDH